jgi:hypothetical protein
LALSRAQKTSKRIEFRVIDQKHQVALVISRRCCCALIAQFGFASLFGLAQTNPPAIRSQSTAVLVPTLVKTKTGNIVFGLSARDFIVEDNGVEQSVQVDESAEAGPLSVVVAVQVGRTAALQLQTSRPHSLEDDEHSGNRGAPLGGLGTMLESYIGQSTAAVAVVTFDSQAHLLQDFTDDIPVVVDKLRKLVPGDDGAAILDAVLYSNVLLDRRPGAGRRVIILISESRTTGVRSQSSITWCSN